MKEHLPYVEFDPIVLIALFLPGCTENIISRINI